VNLSKDGRILSFDEKPGSAEVHTTQRTLVNGGVYLLEKKALATVTPGRAASMERDVFPGLARRGLLAGVVEDGYFADIGTPESLAAFEDDLNRGVVPGIAGN
jgi:NDP-sugar pyrophosphorylase family protein